METEFTKPIEPKSPTRVPPTQPVPRGSPKPADSETTVGPVAPPTDTDTVSLSPQAKNPSINIASERRTQDDFDMVHDVERKRTMTEHDQLVIKIYDKTSEKLIRQIPTEAEIKLKQAIRQLLDQRIPEP